MEVDPVLFADLEPRVTVKVTVRPRAAITSENVTQMVVGISDIASGWAAGVPVDLGTTCD